MTNKKQINLEAKYIPPYSYLKFQTHFQDQCNSAGCPEIGKETLSKLIGNISVHREFKEELNLGSGRKDILLLSFYPRFKYL